MKFNGIFYEDLCGDFDNFSRLPHFLGYILSLHHKNLSPVKEEICPKLPVLMVTEFMAYTFFTSNLSQASASKVA